MKITYEYFVRVPASLTYNKSSESRQIRYFGAYNTWGDTPESISPFLNLEEALGKVREFLLRAKNYPESTIDFVDALEIQVRAKLVSDIETYTGQDLDKDN